MNRDTATWDPEASIWIAESEHVPGPITEAESLEALTAKLRTLMPELLEANGIVTDDVLPFRLSRTIVPFDMPSSG